jgi:transposase-like protein
MLELIEGAEMAIDELIDVMGRATVEAVLLMSAEQVAGPRTPGRKGGEVRWHGSQAGVVSLSERKLRVCKPRLRKKGKGKDLETAVPAYDALRDDQRLSGRILEILMRGVSTRKYEKVLPEMAETVGVSKSSVSREFIEASEQALKSLCERRFDEVDLLVIYIDGQVFGSHHIITAMGVDAQGCKHVLGVVEGATENAAAATALLEDLVERGVKPGRKRLFVIDGSKGLRKAVDTVFGKQNPVQRCRSHKVRNVMGYLPEHLKDQVKAAMQAAFKLGADEAMARLEKQAQWLEREHPSAAASLREGLDELFTVNRIGLPASLRRCLTTTNIIESPHGGVRVRTGRVSRWKDGAMVLRWAAASFLDAEKAFRRIMGYRDLWMLKAHLDALEDEVRVDNKKRVA